MCVNSHTICIIGILCSGTRVKNTFEPSFMFGEANLGSMQKQQDFLIALLSLQP